MWLIALPRLVVKNILWLRLTVMGCLRLSCLLRILRISLMSPVRLGEWRAVVVAVNDGGWSTVRRGTGRLLPNMTY